MKTIIANPPFSASWDADPKLLADPRFTEYGKLAPKSKADFAFVQDMVHNLDDDGTMAVVLPHGVLFRGAAEGIIRRHLIEKMNCLDAVIGLPASLFFGTSIPTCILVFRKNRAPADSILFIDASKDFIKLKNKNTLNDSQINKIYETYACRQVINKYSYNADLSEIVSNDYNLNIARYVDTFEEEEEIDIFAVLNEITSLEKQREKLDKQIDLYFIELGIKQDKIKSKDNPESQQQ